MSITEDLAVCLLRELDTAVDELEAFPTDDSVWELPAGAPNSAGTLALHLAGNLRHFVGAVLGASGYPRDRELEFSARGLPRTELIAGLHSARSEVGAALASLDDSDLGSLFPIKIAGIELTTGRALVHLSVHAAYHVGQIDYCRRLTTGDAKSVGAMGMKQLKLDD